MLLNPLLCGAVAPHCPEHGLRGDRPARLWPSRVTDEPVAGAAAGAAATGAAGAACPPMPTTTKLPTMPLISSSPALLINLNVPTEGRPGQ